MISFHWTAGLCGLIAAAAIYFAIREGTPKGDFDMSPLLGCGILMAGVVVILAVMLVHAWGWL